MFNAFVYILASERNGTLYIGVTTNLPKRIWEHPTSVVDGFTTKYNVKTLVWYEVHDSIEGARLREKQLKKWRRCWKPQLIEDSNPPWVVGQFEISFSRRPSGIMTLHVPLEQTTTSPVLVFSLAMPPPPMNA